MVSQKGFALFDGQSVPDYPPNKANPFWETIFWCDFVVSQEGLLYGQFCVKWNLEGVILNYFLPHKVYMI